MCPHLRDLVLTILFSSCTNSCKLSKYRESCSIAPSSPSFAHVHVHVYAHAHAWCFARAPHKMCAIASDMSFVASYHRHSRESRMSSTVPSSGELDRWVEVAKKCEYLPENDLKVEALVFCRDPGS